MNAIVTKSGRPIGPVQRDPEPEHPEVAAALADVDQLQRAYEDAAASTDPKLIGQARRALDTARARVEQSRAALRGRERRAQQKAAREAERQQAAARVAYYEWAAEAVRRFGLVVEAQQRLDEAREQVQALGTQPRWDEEAHGGPWEPIEGRNVREAAGRVVNAALAVGRGQEVRHPLLVMRFDRRVEERPTGMLDGDSGAPIMKRVTVEGEPYEHWLMEGDNGLDRLAEQLDQLADAARQEPA